MNEEFTTRVCEYCGVEFQPFNGQMVFCKTNHRNQARRRRKRDKDRLALNQLCHTPYKQSYSSFAAWVQAGLPDNQEPYTCACGSIHSATKRVGGQSPAIVKKVAEGGSARDE